MFDIVEAELYVRSHLYHQQCKVTLCAHLGHKQVSCIHVSVYFKISQILRVPQMFEAVITLVETGGACSHMTFLSSRQKQEVHNYIISSVSPQIMELFVKLYATCVCVLLMTILANDQSLHVSGLLFYNGQIKHLKQECLRGCLVSPSTLT